MGEESNKQWWQVNSKELFPVLRWNITIYLLYLDKIESLNLRKACYQKQNDRVYEAGYATGLSSIVHGKAKNGTYTKKRQVAPPRANKLGLCSKKSPFLVEMDQMGCLNARQSLLEPLGS